jgi:protease II
VLLYQKRPDTVGEFAGPKPLREKLFAAWRQTGRKQDFCPDKHNHNAEYRSRLSPWSDFANSIRPFARGNNTDLANS